MSVVFEPLINGGGGLVTQSCPTLCDPVGTVQLSHPYMTTGKTIALTRQTFVGKVMSLLLNMLSIELF